MERLKDSVIKADVEVTELMGAETYLYLDIEGNKFTARVKPTTGIMPGDKIEIAIDPERINIFDKETETTICN